MSLVEDAYFRAWGKVGGAGRLRRSFSLFAEIWGMLEFRIRKEHPGIKDREAQSRTAQRMYASNTATLGLLDRLRGREMSGQADLYETTARIVAVLAELGVRFHFTGGIVAAYYGDPRFTQDLDIVIELAPDRPSTKLLLDGLSSRYLIHEQAALDAIEHRGLFQAIDEQSMVKIDFHVGEKIPGELDRSTRREIFPGLQLPLVCKEDAIVSKLLWIQQGSHKARHDVIEMLKRDEDYDRAALQERAAALGLRDLLAEVDPSAPHVFPEPSTSEDAPDCGG